MSAQTTGPCTPWVPIGCQAIPTSGAAISGDMLAVAQEILWAKSGRQFDACTVTMRPCRRDCFGDAWPFGFSQYPQPYWWNGQWFNLGCGSCPGTCSCTAISEVMLPGPVASVSEVKIDGVALTPIENHVMLYDYRRLIRVDGELWPLCNDLTLPDTEVGTWSITMSIGTEVPRLGQLALGELMMELINACIGAACKLPAPVQQVVRQGVTLTMFDPNTVFADGKIGLRLSDLFISTFNPGGVPARAKVYDPDDYAHKQVTWPP